MEPKLCETCGLNPALPGADECSICLLGYDSAEAKKTQWLPLLQSERIEIPGVSGYTHVMYDNGQFDDDEDDNVWLPCGCHHTCCTCEGSDPVDMGREDDD